MSKKILRCSHCNEPVFDVPLVLHKAKVTMSKDGILTATIKPLSDNYTIGLIRCGRCLAPIYPNQIIQNINRAIVIVDIGDKTGDDNG